MDKSSTTTGSQTTDMWTKLSGKPFNLNPHWRTQRVEVFQNLEDLPITFSQKFKRKVMGNVSTNFTWSSIVMNCLQILGMKHQVSHS